MDPQKDNLTHKGNLPKAINGVPADLSKRKIPLGSLNDPIVASGPGLHPNFGYQGGPIIKDPQVYTIYLGDWTSAANQARANRLDQFISDLMNSEYMNMLAQYGCGSTGNFVQHVFIPSTDTDLLQGDINTMLQTAIDNGQIPEPDNPSNTYLIYLDDSTGVNDAPLGIRMCEPTSDNAFGFHDVYNTVAGNNLFFAIIPGLSDTCLTNSCPSDAGCSLHLAQTQEQRQTQVCSHEFAEMITDPLNNSAWVEPGVAENGDICNGNAGTITVGANTWTVQLMYSKWDDLQSNGATMCVTGSSTPLPSLLPDCSLIVNKNTFGKDEVDSIISGGNSIFTDSLYIIIEGYSPAQLGFNSGNLNSSPSFVSFTGSFHALSNVTIPFDTATGVELADAANLNNIQRITIPYNVQFHGNAAFSGVPVNPGYKVFGLIATVNVPASGSFPGLHITDAAEFELMLNADPFMVAGDVFWLSNDMRVFQVTPALIPAGNTPLINSTSMWTGNPVSYIQAVISEMNANDRSNPPASPFNSISTDENSSALELHQNDDLGNPVYNFALARVRLTGDMAQRVRVFFRLFVSSSPDTDYNQATTYPRASHTIGGNNVVVPLLGIHTNDMSTSTIPFFAVDRVDTTTTSMANQNEDTPNVQVIPQPAAGQTNYAYFGCWLDINQPAIRFPFNPADSHGPWASGAQSIPAVINANHACLVTEIAYDPDPVIASANPSNSDKLGQRNLAWSPSDNPGSPDAHREPFIFDVRPTDIFLSKEALPDELMIQWGNTPVGSTATIFWPNVNIDNVIELANSIYTTRLLSKVDNNTLQCITGKLTYIPIPREAGSNFAGIITVSLPSTVRQGQEFKIVIHRISYRFKSKENNIGMNVGKRDFSNERYVVGSFQLNIPVSLSELLLKDEETNLAVFKWKLGLLPIHNRWYPVIKKYVEQISLRVDAFGGNANDIKPSLQGIPVIPEKADGEKECECAKTRNRCIANLAIALVAWIGFWTFSIVAAMHLITSGSLTAFGWIVLLFTFVSSLVASVVLIRKALIKCG